MNRGWSRVKRREELAKLKDQKCRIIKLLISFTKPHPYSWRTKKEYYEYIAHKVEWEVVEDKSMWRFFRKVRKKLVSTRESHDDFTERYFGDQCIIRTMCACRAHAYFKGLISGKGTKPVWTELVDEEELPEDE